MSFGSFYNENPFENMLSGYESGLRMRRFADENKLLRAEQDYKAQAMQELQGLDFNDRNAVRQFAARYPEYGKGAKEYIDALDEKRTQALRSDMSKTISLLQNKRSDLAVQDLQNKALAFRNSGDEKTALEYEDMANWISTDSNSAFNGLMMSYALITDKDNATNYETMIKTNRPTTEFKNAGDRYVPVTTDGITGDVVVGDADAIDIGVSPDVQLQQDTAITTTEMNNETQKYVSDNTRAASEYGANLDYQGRVYASDNSLKGSMYASDVGYAGQVYSSDQATIRAQADAESRERIEQAKLLHQAQQADIKNNQGEIFDAGDGYKMVYYRATGQAEYLVDKQGNKIKTSSANNPNSPAVKQQEERQRIQKLTATLDEIETLLPSATGSGIGAGIDWLGRQFGYSTQGATATTKLRTLGGQAVALMPKMSGPQSDKDVELYKQMAGKLDDPTIPVKEKQEALKTIRRLNERYAQINGTPDASRSSNYDRTKVNISDIVR